MGHPEAHPPVLLVLAAFSRHGEALDWARRRAEPCFGPVARESPRFAFDQTDYYAASMGSGLVKQFFAFERLVDPARLPELKRLTNAWEDELAAEGTYAEARPLNLDPGYLTAAKLVLASTKDFAHRVYLRDGIYAEVTLHYRHGRWEPHTYTFPDYRGAAYHEFFDRCRTWLKQRAARR